MLTKPIFFCGGVRLGSINSKPITIPTAPPTEQNSTERHSSWIFIQKIVNAAAVIPTDWIINEKSRAIEGLIWNANVITGNATLLPPSLVIPIESKVYKEWTTQETPQNMPSTLCFFLYACVVISSQECTFYKRRQWTECALRTHSLSCTREWHAMIGSLDLLTCSSHK